MFGLFEAMSAIEMMDPKMDAGMKCNRFRGRSKTKDGGALLNPCFKGNIKKLWTIICLYLCFPEEIDGPLKFSTAIGTQYMPVESVSLADQVNIFTFRKW